MPSDIRGPRPGGGRPFTPDTARIGQLRGLSTRRTNRILDLLGRGPIAQADKQRILAATATTTDLDALLASRQVAS